MAYTVKGSPTTDDDAERLFVPIREEVIARCEAKVVGATSLLFRPFEEGVHQEYAKAFVAELVRRLNLKPISLVKREQCLTGVIWYFTQDAEIYKASTNLFTEFGLMFEVIEAHLKELMKSESESEESVEE